MHVCAGEVVGTVSSLSTCSAYGLVAVVVVVAIVINLLIVTAFARCLLLRSLRLASAVLFDDCRVWHAILYSLRNPICGCWATIKPYQGSSPRYSISCCRAEAYHLLNGTGLSCVKNLAASIFRQTAEVLQVVSCCLPGPLPCQVRWTVMDERHSGRCYGKPAWLLMVQRQSVDAVPLPFAIRVARAGEDLSASGPGQTAQM